MIQTKPCKHTRDHLKKEGKKKRKEKTNIIFNQNFKKYFMHIQCFKNKISQVFLILRLGVQKKKINCITIS